MRRLRRADRRPAAPVLPGPADRASGAGADPDRRRPRGRVDPPSPSRHLRRAGRGAVRLLHPRHAGDRQSAPGPDARPHARADCRGALGQPVPLHRLCENLRSRGVGRRTSARRAPGTRMMTIEADPEIAEFDVVGTSLRKPDGLPKTTGSARYADDLKLPRMGFCRLLRSTRPHATILSIDTSAARALPGVFGVITGRDLPVKYGVLPVGQDEQALCIEKVRYVGDAVAAVAAVDEATAERALGLRDVAYAEVPTYLSIEQGLTQAGEPIHHGR